MIKTILGALAMAALGGFLVYTSVYEPYVAMAQGVDAASIHYSAKAQIFGILLALGWPGYLIIAVQGERIGPNGEIFPGSWTPYYVGTGIGILAILAAIYLPFFWFPDAVRSFGYEPQYNLRAH